MAIWLYHDGVGACFTTNRTCIPDHVRSVKVDSKGCPMITTIAERYSDELDHLFDGVDELNKKLAKQASKKPPVRKKR